MIDISDKDLLPEDIMSDNIKEDRVRIKVLAPDRFGFTSLVNNYKKAKGIIFTKYKNDFPKNQQNLEDKPNKKSKRFGWMKSKMKQADIP